MRLQRLVVEDGNQSFALDVHDHLTVVGVDDALDRERVVAELLHSFGPARDGVHTEFVDHQARSLTAFRPRGAPHLVIDIETSANVTTRYASPGGRVDMLAHTGLDVDSAARMMSLTASQLDSGIETGTDNHQLARRLSQLDQKDLWSAAERVRSTQQHLAAEVDTAGGTISDALAFEAVERVHDSASKSARSSRSVVIVGLVVGLICLVSAAIIWPLWDPWTARLLALLGAAACLVGLLNVRPLRAARGRERYALNKVGATDFGTYQNSAGSISDGERRSALFQAGEDADKAAEFWSSFAGDVPHEWALANRAAISNLAERRAMAGIDLDQVEGSLSRSARTLVDHVVDLREIGTAREQLPLVLNDPFTDLSGPERRQLFDTICRLAQNHQIIAVTTDATVASWTQSLQADRARLERVDPPTRVAESVSV